VERLMPLTPAEALEIVTDLVTLADRIRKSSQDGWTPEERKAIGKAALSLMAKIARDMVD
jgi:hypothetical protein